MPLSSWGRLQGSGFKGQLGTTECDLLHLGCVLVSKLELLSSQVDTEFWSVGHKDDIANKRPDALSQGIMEERSPNQA